MTTHELIQNDIVDSPNTESVDPVASLVKLGNAAYPFIRRFLDTWFPGEDDFILSVSGYALRACYVSDGSPINGESVRWDNGDMLPGLPIIDASVLWSFIVTDPLYN